MATYTRPAVTRSYDAIYNDIVETHLHTDPSVGTAEFWRLQAEGCERKRDLWNEIAFRASGDKELPVWARFAAIHTRDEYAREAREARRMAGLSTRETVAL